MALPPRFGLPVRGGAGRTRRYPDRALIVFHLALAATLVLGAAFDDALGRLLRLAAVALVLLGCLAVLSRETRGAHGGWPRAGCLRATLRLRLFYSRGTGGCCDTAPPGLALRRPARLVGHARLGELRFAAASGRGPRLHRDRAGIARSGGADQPDEGGASPVADRHQGSCGPPGSGPRLVDQPAPATLIGTGKYVHGQQR